MLVEELMILANEHVAEFLAGRNREALYRVHERPDPQAVELLLAKLADLDVPTPPAPKRLSPQSAAALAGEISRRVAAYVGQSGRGREAFPSLVLRALKQARYDPRNLGHSGLASTAYCHFTSPIRRYPDLVVHRALLRELGQGDDRPPDDLIGLAEHASAREREAAQLEYLADDICLAWLLEDVLLERGLGGAVGGRDHGRDRLRPLRPLRRRLRGLPPGAPPARRVLRAEPDRDRARRPPLGPALPARRPDRGARRVDREHEGKVELALGATARSGPPRRGSRREALARSGKMGKGKPAKRSARSAAARPPSASARGASESCSLRSTLETWLSIVFTERCSRAAISL